MTFRNGKKLRIYDCRGVHPSEWAAEEYKNDLINAIDGRIRKDYEVYIFSLFKTYFAYLHLNFSVFIIDDHIS